MKISYINGLCVHHDAISNAIKDEIGLLLQQEDMDVRLYAYACDYQDIPFQRVGSVADIALDPHFQASELVVFHFGVYYPMFDLLPAVSSKARRLVIFHNITPKEMLPSHAWDTIRRSNLQLANAAWADHVICVSATNLVTLRKASIATPATVLPLAVHVLSSPAAKPSFVDGRLRIVFLGRFVWSKGPQDLLAALAMLAERLPDMHIEMDLIGNFTFSDQELLKQLRVTAAEVEARHGARLRITFHGNLPENDKQTLLTEADLFVLPTYHEGFCVPIIEALASGCRVVAYDNSNTPSISGGLATLIPTGDVALLAQAMQDIIGEVSEEAWRREGYQAHVSRAQIHVTQFEPARVGRRFIRFIEDFTRRRGVASAQRITA